MRTDLEVPFAEKDEAKTLGARWDSIKKTWYAENQQPISKFSKWMQTPLSPNSSGTSRNDAPKVDACDCSLMWECDSCRNNVTPKQTHIRTAR